LPAARRICRRRDHVAKGSGMKEISAAHLRLGQELRRIRKGSGVSTRQVRKLYSSEEYFSSGHISLVENGRTVPSPELVDAYAELAGDSTRLRALYAQMLAASASAARQRRGGTAQAETPAPQTLADVTTREEIQQHYVVERHEAEYSFEPAGAIEAVHFTVALRAVSENVRLYCSGHQYAADPRPGVLLVEAESGAGLLSIRESVTGAVQSFFQLDRAIGPSDPEPCTVTYRLHVNSQVRSAPHLRYHAEEGNLSLVLHTRFQPPTVPTRIWWFGAKLLDAEHHQPNNELPVDDAHSYSRTFEQLVPGWCYGFGWIW
jgi:transcriptional regulator with XRE-family HTH domain